MLRPLRLLCALVCLALLGAGACSKTRLGQVLPAGARIDVFPQNARAQLDALFVIDNSKYMTVHQSRVAAQMGRFVGWLDRAQIDWHIGLVTTDVNATPGQFVSGGFYTNDTEGSLPGAVLSIGGNGAAIAAALEQMELGLKGPPAGFLRDGADLFLVAVTDNNDPWSPGSDDYYFRVFKGAKGKGNDGIVTLSALAGDLPSGCTIPDPNNPSGTFFAEPAPRLNGLVTRMGGRFKSLCDPAFDQVFDELGATAAGLKRQFRLAKLPDPATLVVRVRATCDTKAESLTFCASVEDQCGESDAAQVCTPRAAATGVDGWSFDADANSILFSGNALPPRGSVVEVQYTEKGTAQ